MSDNIGRKQIARSTIHLSNIPSSQVVDGVIYLQNLDWDDDQHGEGRVNDSPSLNIDNFGATEFQPNQNEEEDSCRYWGDNELDSSSSEGQINIKQTNIFSVLADLKPTRSVPQLRRTRKRKRTLNTVISKPRICKRRKENLKKAAVSNKVSYKILDWKFSNLPIAKLYRQIDNVSTDSEDDIMIVRKEDWRKRREHKLKKLTISLSSDSTSREDEGVCLCCVSGPQDTILVHEDTGHLCCCRNCAKRLWKLGVHCPVCGLQVTRIIDYEAN